MRRALSALLALLALAAGAALAWWVSRPEPGVAIDVRADRVVVQNRDGTWTVLTRCLDDVAGPGYVARLVAADGRVLVDDLRGPGTLNDTDFGGLGAFGWHHARGEPEATRFHADNAWEVSGRRCAGANGGFGVSSARLVEHDGDAFTVEVELSDGYTHPRPVMRVRYRYLVEPRTVRVEVAATELCPGGRCGRSEAVAFLKEPKLVAHAGPAFARMRVLDERGDAVCGGRPAGPPVGPILETTQCDSPRRATLVLGPCEPTCLRVEARGGDGSLWHGAEGGFDAWARAAAVRPRAFARDTASVDGVVWPCHGGSPADRRMRRWELAGREGGSLGALFPAWEGGRGGYDCEPLARAFGPHGATWRAALAYALVP